MKKILPLLLIPLFLTTVMAATANPIFHSFFVDTYPDPAVPGNQVRLETTLTNLGTETYYNISTEIDPAPPFTGIKTTDSVQKINPGQRTTVTYLLELDKDASAGQYTMNHKMNYFKKKWSDATDETYSVEIEDQRTIGINVENKERIEIDKISQPNQLLAGESGTVKPVIKNTGNVPINDIEISLSSQSTYLSSLAPSTQYIDTLEPGEEKVLSFSVRARDPAQTGVYSLDLGVDYKDVSYSQPIQISVSGYPALEVMAPEFEEQPEPGKETNANICLKNLGEYSLENFYASLSARPPQTNVSMTAANPMITILGSGNKFVEELDSRKTHCLEYDMAFSESLEEGPYNLYLSLTGSNFQRTAYPIGINIKGIPKMTLSDLDSDKEIIYANEPFKMSVQFENEGTGEAKNVKAMTDGKTVYSGSIDVDDSSTAVFRMKLSEVGMNKIPITVKYEDREGKEYEQDFEVKLEANQKPMDWMPIILLLIVIAVIAFFVYRRKKS